MLGRAVDVVMHDTRCSGRLKPVKKSQRLTYSEQLRVAGVKGDGEVTELFLPAEDQVNVAGKADVITHLRSESWTHRCDNTVAPLG